LADSIEKSLAEPLRRIADSVEAPRLEHAYGVAIAELPQHGKVWGSYCIACSAAEQEYVYPCSKAPEEQLKPPPFFSIGNAYIPREDGAFQVYEGGLPTY
jgi:hypothetical protein